MKINSLLSLTLLLTAVSASAVTLEFADTDLLINGVSYPYSGSLHAMLHSNDANGTDGNKLNWIAIGTDGSGNVWRTLFKFNLGSLPNPSITVNSASFVIHCDWMNGNPFNDTIWLGSTLPFNSTASWTHPDNPGTSAPAGGAIPSAGIAGNYYWTSPGAGDQTFGGSWATFLQTNNFNLSSNTVSLISFLQWSPSWNSIGGFSNPRLDLTVTLTTGPAIVTQPSVSPSNPLYSGNSIAMSVVAATDYTPTFQWYKDGTLIDPNVDLNATITSTNAYDSELVLANTATTDSGHYYVIVTDANGSTTSISNNVTILPHVSPIITSQPQSVTGYAPGMAVSLAAGVNGTPPFTYQWTHAGTNLTDDGIKYFGSASNVLTLAALTLNAADAGNYVLNVTNSFGGTNTHAAVLTVISNLAQNPLFGDGVATTDFTDWTPSGSTVAATDATYGTVAHLPFAWEYIYQFNSSSVTFQPHTLYTLTAAIHGSAGVYGVFNDGTTGADWLGGGYNWLGGGGWADHTFTFDTGSYPSVVGDALGFRFRSDNGDAYVANVRVTAAPGAAAPAPTITAPAWSTSTPGGFQFTINSWPQTAYNVLVSADLMHWVTNTVVTNVSGTDVFLDSAPVGSARFYRLQAH